MIELTTCDCGEPAYNDGECSLCESDRVLFVPTKSKPKIICMKTYEYRELHIGCYGQEIWLEWKECTLEVASVLERTSKPTMLQIRTIIPGIA